MRIEQYVNQLREQLGRMDDEEREAVLLEVRDYLDQESERLRNLSPGLGKQRAVMNAIADFGAPEDIAVVYDGKLQEIAIVNQRTGEWLLDLPTIGDSIQGRKFATTARALRVIIKYRGVTVLGLLGLAALFMAAALFFADQEQDVHGTEDQPLYQYHEQWGMEDAVTTTVTDPFDVTEEVAEFTWQFEVQSTMGCVRIEVLGPSGDAWSDTGEVCDGAEVSDTFTSSGAGTWSVRYTYTAFAGDVRVDAYHSS